MFEFKVDADLTLRPLEMRHAEAVFDLVDANRAHLERWLPWPSNNLAPTDSAAFIQAVRQQDAIHGCFVAGLWTGDKLAGVVGHNSIDWGNRISHLGYWLGEEFQGRGLMTRACRAVVGHDLLELKLNRVDIRVATGNVKSQAIAQRLGFAREGVLRDAEWLGDHFVDHIVYGMLARDWPFAVQSAA